MNKKGFTLVELLAVIVILAIIAMITVPVVLNTISKVDMKTFQISVEEVTNNVDKYLIINNLKRLPYCSDEPVIIRNIDFLKNRTIFSKDSYICFDNNQKCNYIYAKSSDDNKNAIYAYGCRDDIVITKLNGDLDLSPPEYNTFSFARASSSITVYIDWYDDSEIKEIKYAIREKGSKDWSQWQSSNIFKKLKKDTEYEIKSMAKNKSNISGYAKKSTTTEDIDEPEYSLDNYNWADSKVVTITYPAPRENEEYIYSYSLDGGNTWIETSNKITKVTFTENGNVIARVFDGDNYKTASSFTVSKVDKTDPSCTLTIIQGTIGNNSYYKDNVTVKLITSKAGASGIEYSLPTTSTTETYSNSVSSGSSSYATSTLTGNGNFTVYGYVKTGVGKKASCKIAFKKDSNPTSLNLTLQKETSKTVAYQSTWSTENIVITAVPTASSAPSGYSYQWYKDGTEISGATDKTYTATTSGTYKVRVTSGSGITKEGSAILNIDKCTTPTLSLSGKKQSAGTTITSGNWSDENITITANPTCNDGGSSGYRYQWYKDGTEISGATSKTYTATTKANYSVKVTLGNNKYVTATYNAYIDKTTPSCTLSVESGTLGVTGWYTSSVGVKITTSKAGSSGISFSYPTTATTASYSSSITSGNVGYLNKIFSADGTYSLKGYVKNGAGKTSTCSKSIKVDSTSPVYSFSSAREYCLTDKIDINVTDSASGVNNSSCYLYNQNKVTDGFIKEIPINGNKTIQMSEYGDFTLKCQSVNNANLYTQVEKKFTVKPCAGDTYSFMPDTSEKSSVNCGNENGTCYKECYGKLCYAQGPKLVSVSTPYGVENRLYLRKYNSSGVGIQYGPYMNFAPGCYKVSYYGNRLNSANLEYLSYEIGGKNYTSEINNNITKTYSRVSYKLYFSGSNTVNGLEFRLDSTHTNNDSSDFTGIPYLTKVVVEYIGSSC